MSEWKEFAGAPERLELLEQRMTPGGGNEFRTMRIRSTVGPLQAPDRPFRWDDGTVRVARPWAEAAKEERPMTPAEVAARCDATFFRDRRPMRLAQPVRAKPGRRRRQSGSGEMHLYFAAAWWS